jgi:hypothetical protein
MPEGSDNALRESGMYVPLAGDLGMIHESFSSGEGKRGRFVVVRVGSEIWDNDGARLRGSIQQQCVLSEVCQWSCVRQHSSTTCTFLLPFCHTSRVTRHLVTATRWFFSSLRSLTGIPSLPLP